jgi:hypothetical protein
VGEEPAAELEAAEAPEPAEGAMGEVGEAAEGVVVAGPGSADFPLHCRSSGIRPDHG